MSRLRIVLASILLVGVSTQSVAHAQPRPSRRHAQPERAPSADDEDEAAPPPLPPEPASPTTKTPKAGEPKTDDEAADSNPSSGEEAGKPYTEPKEPSIVVPRTVCEGRVIDKILVKGSRRVSDEDVLASMHLRAGLPCTDDEVATDVRALWDLGFFDHIAVDATPSGERLIVTIVVKERPAIGKIAYEGNDAIEQSDLEEGVDLREGAILSVPKLQTQVTKIRDMYAEKGYFLARVSYSFRRMPDNEVEVKFKISEGQEVAVRSVRFVGNQHLSDSELRDAMQTRATGFFSFLSSNDNFQRQHFDEDVTRLQVVYYDQGFLDVHIGTPRIELTADRHFIDITVPISEGPRFKVGRMRVDELDPNGKSIEPLGGRRALREKITLASNDWFSRASIAKDLLEIRRVYRDAGYAKVQVEPRTQLDAKRRIVHVTIAIQRGPLVRIQRINVGGNTKTRDSVIRREIRIAEGELYSQTKIEESKARITALGYFERVDVAEESGSKANTLVVNFEVAERATGTFQVGAGFSSFESFIFTSQVQQQNLFGQGQSLTLQLQLSGIRQLAQVQFVEPYFYDTEWTLGLEAFKTIRQFQAFNRDSTGGSVTFGHPFLTDELRLFLQYKAEFVDISSRTNGLFGATGGGTGFNIFQPLPLANLYRSGLTSSLRLSLTWDTRDNRLFPTNGVYASASTEVAPSWLGSQNNFIRHRLFARFYKPLFAGFVFKMNTEWGLITSNQPQGVPIFERFFLGGILNVRGFPLYSLGPRAGIPAVLDPNASVNSVGYTIGGNMQAFYNIELEFPIIESVGIRGVVFTDGGNAWNTENVLCQSPRPSAGDSTTDACGINLLQLRTSWGFGLRWLSPLGPLRFEWGLPFNPRPYERPILFEFTIGNFF